MSLNDLACLCCSYAHGIGPDHFSQLVRYFGSPELILSVSDDELKAAFPHKVIQNFISFRKTFDYKKILRALEQQKISYIAQSNPAYPTLLKHIPDPPIGLFCKGDVTLFSNTTCVVAVVGTRKPSCYGASMTRKLTMQLAQRGTLIISGMALGVDTCAHQAALCEQGKTIAVLGCGVDIVYPPSNKGLYEEILQHNGLIISEFPPGQIVLKGLFVARNRIVSGLSHGILVIEGTSHSGSLITAMYAAQQGRELLALPGQVGSELSEAPLMLLKQGAFPITCVEDIFNALGKPITGTKGVSSRHSLSQNQSIVFTELSREYLTTDDLLRKVPLTLTALSSVLSELELGGIIKKNSEGAWQIL